MDKDPLGVFHSILENVYVTCLKFFGSYLWTGQAGSIHIFDLSDLSLLNPEKVFSLKVFPSQNIYGIIFNTDLVIVFGGKFISILNNCGVNPKDISISKSWKAEDWILDGVWSENSSVILLTSHNVILHYTTVPNVELLEKVICSERCLLYSGKIFGSALNDIIVFAGTVYQEVIVWTSSHLEEKSYKPVLQRLQGHKGVIFSTVYDNDTQRIASTSDDRTVRVWSVKFPLNPKNLKEKWLNAEISLSFSAFVHTSRVWRCIFTSTGQLLTVGEDSSICLWSPEGNLLSRWEHIGEIWCIDYAKDCFAVGGNGAIVRYLSSLSKEISLSISEFGSPKQAVLSICGDPIITSDVGYLIRVNGSTLENTPRDERFSSYSIISISPSREYIALGGIHGDVVIYLVKNNVLSKVFEFNTGEKRIYSLTWASNYYIILCSVNGALTILKILEINGSFSFDSSLKFCLPHSKERWINCALILDNFLIVGDRMGSLHLYSFTTHCQDPLHSYLKLHGTNGVTDVNNLNGIIYSTGRDGTLRELQVVDNSLVLISTLKLPMDWAVGIISTKSYGLLIAGFHDVNFVLWSVNERISLLVLECGGGHRSFDFLVDEIRKNLVLTYIRLKGVKYICSSLEKLAHRTVLSSFHKKSINGASLIKFSKNEVILVTGGEDNSLRLSSFHSPTWNCYSTYMRHISAVRTVKCLGNIIVSAGGRAQMIVWHVDSNTAGEFRLKELKSHMLRDEAKFHKSWKDAEPLADPEIRFMDVQIMEPEGGRYSIYAACSDGILREFKFDIETRELLMIKSIDCYQGCLLRLFIFTWKNQTGIVTSGTKGTVVFWKTPLDSHSSRAHSLHSLGINALDHVIMKGKLIIASGGDDTSISLAVFTLGRDMNETLEFSIIEHVHSCQVSDLKITEDLVISASVDQRVCILSWNLEGNYLKSALIGRYLTSVPDIHGLVSWEVSDNYEKEVFILVYGCGLQLIKFRRFEPITS